jgi:hypothetical protein
MGYGLMVHAVDFALLKRVAGSRDKNRLEQLKNNARMQHEIKEHNEYFSYSIDNGAPRLEKALEDIIMGTVPQERNYGYAYGYAYLHLSECCRGIHLSNSYWCPTPFSSIIEVDEIYEKGGLSSRRVVSDLVLKGALIKGLPSPDDFPAMGYVLPEKVLEVNAEMEQLDMNKLLEGHDRITQGAIQQVRDWYKEAALLNLHSGSKKVEIGLIGKYH